MNDKFYKVWVYNDLGVEVGEFASVDKVGIVDGCLRIQHVSGEEYLYAKGQWGTLTKQVDPDWEKEEKELRQSGF